MLTCRLEAVEGVFSLLEVSELMCCVLLSLLEVLEVLVALDVPEVPEAMCCVLLCVLEDVEGGLCLLVVLEVLEMLDCMLRCTAGGCGGYVLFAGGDAPCAALYAGGRGG